MTARAHRSADELATLLSRARVASRIVRVGGDLFVPILLPGGDTLDCPDAELLDEGLAERHTVLREIGEHGDVNRILVSHYGKRLLLLLDGEQIIGAKQNRVFNASFLIAPDAHEVEVHVSCVERGRWAFTDRRFSGSSTTLTGLARSRMLSRVTQSVLTGGDYDAQQRVVWDDVDDYLDRSRVVSRTSALEDALRSRRDDTLVGMEALAPLPEQIGLALVRNRKVVLMDLFGSVALYKRGHQTVASGMLSDPAPGKANPEGAPAIVAEVVRRLRHAAVVRRPGPSVGETLHTEVSDEGGGAISMGAVAYGGRIYHMAAAVA